MSALPTFGRMNPAALLWMTLQVAAVPQSDVAEPEPVEAGSGSAEMLLGRHQFILPVLEESAFVTTHVGIREGTELLSVPRVPVGNLGPQDLSATMLQQTLEVGARFTPWFGVDAGLRGRVMTGLDLGSLVGLGSVVDGGFQLSPILRLVRIEATGTQLSLRVRAEQQWTERATVTPFVQALIDTPLPSLRSVFSGDLGQLLLVPESQTGIAGGLFLAQSLGPTVSFQLSAMPEHLWTHQSPFIPSQRARVELDGHAFRLRLHGAMTVNLDPLGVPMALAAEAQYFVGRDSPPALPAVDRRVLTLAGAVYYSGRPNLQLGVLAGAVVDPEPLQGTDESGQPALSGTPSQFTAQLVFRYIW